MTTLDKRHTQSIRETVSSSSSILESLDDGAGNVWRVTMIRPGLSKNRKRYRAQVLAEACQLYEGAKSFNGHRTSAELQSSGVSKMVGWHTNVAPGPDGSLQSDFHLSESAPQMKALFLSAWKNQRPDLIGFSHDVDAATTPVTEGGAQIADVVKIIKVRSVDVVADPSAGGRLERLVASDDRFETWDQRDKSLRLLEGFVTGAHEGSSSLQDAFGRFFEVPPWEIAPQQIMAAICGFEADRDGRLTESVKASTWAAAFRDSMTKRAIAAYRQPARQAWRRVVSEITPVDDFKAQTRFRIGGYKQLSTVGELSPYPDLVTPTDEEATYAVAKRGGVEGISFEAVANGDAATIRRIADLAGVAAWLSLHRAVFISVLANNPAIYDAVALFHATHANTDTGAPLAQGTLSTGKRKMRSQTKLGEGDDGALSVRPKFLVVPNELEETAFQLTTSNATQPNINLGLEPIVVDELTDPDDWFLVANPAEAPTIEVGFLQGREDPEIIIANDPAEGAMFTADRIGLKIRHVWGLVVLDYRGFYRGQG